MKKILAVFVLLAFPQLARADSQWLLAKSTLTYQVTHPLHKVEGATSGARGKGVCQSGECKFIVAVPVKTFTSGNSDRDLHMVETVRGAQFPMVVVRFQLPEAELASSTIHADLEIQFAGQTAQYKQVPFQRTLSGKDIEVKGTIPLKLTDFKIPLPELLFVPVQNDVPVSVDTTWESQ